MVSRNFKANPGLEAESVRVLGATSGQVDITAPDVNAAFQAEGLDPMRYGIVCYDQWDATDDAPAGDRYGVRYEELLAFIIAAL